MNFPKYDIAIGNATDTGRIRDHNEDYMAHFDTDLGYCIIICDGMGGHAAGEIASQNAINAIQQYLQDPTNKITNIPLALKNAIEFANYQLREMMNQNSQLKGMGTTCVLALVKNGLLYTAHAGDSRIYRINKGGIEQMTKDHSIVQKLVDTGVLTEAEAELSDKKNQISKAIGVFEKTNPTITETPVTLLENDKLLLCSDGLTAHVNKEKIYETVSTVDDVQDAALKLTELANEDGGSDNITVQLVHYTGKPIEAKRKTIYSKKKKILGSTLLMGLLLISIWAYKSYNLPIRNNSITTIQGDSSKTDSLKIKTAPGKLKTSKPLLDRKNDSVNKINPK